MCSSMLPCFLFHIPFDYHTDETLQHAKFNGTNLQNRIHSCITQEHCKSTPQIHVSWFHLRAQNTSNRFFRDDINLNKPFVIITIALCDPILQFFYMFIETALTNIQNAFSVLHSTERCLTLSTKQNRESCRKNLMWTNEALKMSI